MKHFGVGAVLWAATLTAFAFVGAGCGGSTVASSLAVATSHPTTPDAAISDASTGNAATTDSAATTGLACPAGQGCGLLATTDSAATIEGATTMYGEATAEAVDAFAIAIEGATPTGGATPDGATTQSGGWIDRGPSGTAGVWSGVASDASGNHLVAVSAGHLVVPSFVNYFSGVAVSANAGMTWALTSGPALSAVASDPSGTNLVACGGGGISTSVNAGMTWTPSGWAAPTGQSYCTSVASDSTGTHLVAAVGGPWGGDIWTSSNAGVTWTDQTPSGAAHNLTWMSVAADATGTKLIAVTGLGLGAGGPGSVGDIWTSSDSGATWTDQTASGAAHNLTWMSVASDATGTHLIAVGSGIWTSSNSGVTWTQQATNSGAYAWASVASSSDGTHLVAASRNGVDLSTGGDLWTSSDSGVTWTNTTAGTFLAILDWTGVASDSTGAHLVAVNAWEADIVGGDIWTWTN
jgi:hypothetical protein